MKQLLKPDTGRLLLVGVLLLLCGGLAIVSSASSSSAANAASGKQRRPVVYHPYKPVCGPPKHNAARCTAENTVDKYGRPRTGSTPASVSGYGPAEFHTAYALPCKPGGLTASVCSAPTSFGPETIAIVDAGNFSSGVSGLETSLQDYDTNYGIPDCTVANGCLTVLNQSGNTSPLPSSISGWSEEIALDVETAHMICQTCKITLVEGNTATDVDLATAVSTAAKLNPVSISNSWGINVDSPSLDSNFEQPGIAVVASTGDNGTVSNGASWPADIPDVIAAAGTELDLNVDNTRYQELVWSGSGGGCSDYYSAPSWQTSRSDWATNGCGTYRAFGDIAADANPSTGAAVNVNGTWYQIGGTSLSAPLIASMFALAGGVSPGVTGSSVPYGNSSADFYDVTSGNDCTATLTTNCTAQAGFDTPTGLGAPIGDAGFVSGPGQPTLTAKVASKTEIDLSWSATTTGASISSYDLYRDGVKITTTSGTTYNDTNVSYNVGYNYYVIATDANGKVSPASVTVNAFTGYPEDINEDGHINLLDLSLLASKWGQSGPNLGREDINGDGTVNLLDLSLLASTYGSE